MSLLTTNLQAFRFTITAILEMFCLAQSYTNISIWVCRFTILLFREFSDSDVHSPLWAFHFFFFPRGSVKLHSCITFVKTLLFITFLQDKVFQHAGLWRPFPFIYWFISIFCWKTMELMVLHLFWLYSKGFHWLINFKVTKFYIWRSSKYKILA